MNNIINGIIILLTTCVLTVSCGNDKSFFSDRKYAEKVKTDFEQRKSVLPAKRAEALFSVFNRPDLTGEERDALEFLFAYMPLCDLADYDGEFFLAQVRSAFEARKFFAWGKTIPEHIFRHFVLVYRINNENLDNARLVFFNELKDRVKNMSMEQAALEVNHWCHEKVTYRGTDGRTSSPLALVCTSWGRCGEESTFTTTALRAVGIPARQCYTPRWAHTDDNHAWVEVWIDGKWHYLGACEPEPRLDVGWFSSPAKRAMMVHTNVIGPYPGEEAKTVDKPLYSTINLLSNYTDVRDVKVKVTDAAGKPVADAKVSFNLYNYAEYYPVVETVSDAEGRASIQSGNGDLLVWAHKDGVFGYAVSKPGETIAAVVLNKREGDAFEDTYELVPPPERKVPGLPAELAEANGKRLRSEDSIRKAYMNTFIDEKAARDFAAKLKLSPDDTWKHLFASQGNHAEIAKFIEENKDNKDLMAFLGAVTEKDLRDTPAQVLANHLSAGRKFGVKKGTPEDMVVGNVVSPRISTELLRPWRTYFHAEFEKFGAEHIQNNVGEVIDYVNQNVKLNNEWNYYNCPVSPRGVYETGLADKRSRDIFFVALCRSAGIASRLNPATNRPQYYEGEWKTVDFGEPDKIYPQAEIAFIGSKSNLIPPQYSTHYTLARYQDGTFSTLRLRGNSGRVKIDQGYYRLMIGTRANDGSVTVQNKYFTLKENQLLNAEIKMPEVKSKVQVLGIIDMNTKVKLTSGKETTLKELSRGKGLALCFADPDKEPTKHVLQDLPAQNEALNAWDGGVFFLVPDDKRSTAFDPSAFKNLPKNTAWGIDDKRVLLNETKETLKLGADDNFPLTLFLNDNGGILYFSEGYKIGIGEDILKTIKSHLQSCGPR